MIQRSGDASHITSEHACANNHAATITAFAQGIPGSFPTGSRSSLAGSPVSSVLWRQPSVQCPPVQSMRVGTGAMRARGRKGRSVCVGGRREGGSRRGEVSGGRGVDKERQGRGEEGRGEKAEARETSGDICRGMEQTEA